MAGMEEVMGQILQNPQAMQQIFSLAQSLNLGQSAAGPPAPQVPAAPAPPAPPGVPGSPGEADGLFRSILQLAGQSQKGGPQLALFEALKAFVTPDRAKQIDQAILVARIAQMAAGAFQRMPQGPGKGGSPHV